MLLLKPSSPNFYFFYVMIIMFIKEISEFKDYFESLVYCKVENDIITISDEICFNHIPMGVLDKSYFIDKNYKQVNIMDYIKEVTYYIYYEPITYNNFNHMFNLNDRIIKVLENNSINIYQVTYIYKKLLKEYGGHILIQSTDCYKSKRINEHKTKIQTPPNLITKNHTIITTNSYYPNRIYILD